MGSNGRLRYKAVVASGQDYLTFNFELAHKFFGAIAQSACITPERLIQWITCPSTMGLWHTSQKTWPLLCIL